MLPFRVFSRIGWLKLDIPTQDRLPACRSTSAGCNGCNSIRLPRFPRRHLAKAAGVKPTQLRKDLTYFRAVRHSRLGLRCGRAQRQAGRGARDHAPAACRARRGRATWEPPCSDTTRAFAKEGFEIVATFDSEPRAAAPVGSRKVKVQSDCREWRNLSRQQSDQDGNPYRFPGTAAQEVVNTPGGCRAFRRSLISLLSSCRFPENVVVNNVDLAIELENLSYFIR